LLTAVNKYFSDTEHDGNQIGFRIVNKNLELDMNKKLIKMFAVMGVIPVIAFANPLAEYSDPLFSKEPPSGQGMPHHPPGHHGMRFGEHLPPYLHGIDLTDVQKKSIKALIQKNQDAVQAKEKVGIEYRHYIQEQVFSKDYSDEKIAGMVKKSLAKEEGNGLSMAKLDHAIFELLTPPQQQEVQANLRTFSEHLKNEQ
jgi:periplasmic protein CpxP/Spy